MNNTINQIEASSAAAASDAAPAAKPRNSSNSVLIRLAERFGVKPEDLYNTLASTCFKVKKDDGSYGAPSKAEFLSLLLIAEKTGLNPMLGEIYAFPNKKGSGITPIVGVNGWRQIAASNPDYAGVRFEISQEMETVGGVTAPSFICTFVKMRRPDGFVFETEGIAFFSEKFRGDSDPWRKQPRQMLLNKSLIQALKNCMPSCAGLYDDDDAAAMGASAPALPASAAASPDPARDRVELEKKLRSLVALAKARHQWEAATDWIAEKCQGADLKHAMEFITRARLAEAEDARVVELKSLEVKEPAASHQLEAGQASATLAAPEVADDCPF